MRLGSGASRGVRTWLKYTGWQQMLHLVFEARTLGMGVVKSKSDGVRRNPKGSELPLNTDGGLVGLLFCVPCAWHEGPQSSGFTG